MELNNQNTVTSQSSIRKISTRMIEILVGNLIGPYRSSYFLSVFFRTSKELKLRKNNQTWCLSVKLYLPDCHQSVLVSTKLKPPHYAIVALCRFTTSSMLDHIKVKYNCEKDNANKVCNNSCSILPSFFFKGKHSYRANYHYENNKN